MKKIEEIPKIYHEYAQKYEKYNVNEEDLKKVEEVCIETYDPSIGLNLDMYIRINLYFEAISQLYNNIEMLGILDKYKSVVVNHSNNLKKFISKEEIDIIFEDTISQMKQNYDKTESVGSYIVRNFKNNLVEYVNKEYNKDFNKIEEKSKIKLLKK